MPSRHIQPNKRPNRSLLHPHHPFRHEANLKIITALFDSTWDEFSSWLSSIWLHPVNAKLIGHTEILPPYFNVDPKQKRQLAWQRDPKKEYPSHAHVRYGLLCDVSHTYLAVVSDYHVRVVNDKKIEIEYRSCVLCQRNNRPERSCGAFGATSEVIDGVIGDLHCLDGRVVPYQSIDTVLFPRLTPYLIPNDHSVAYSPLGPSGLRVTSPSPSSLCISAERSTLQGETSESNRESTPKDPRAQSPPLLSPLTKRKRSDSSASLSIACSRLPIPSSRQATKRQRFSSPSNFASSSKTDTAISVPSVEISPSPRAPRSLGTQAPAVDDAEIIRIWTPSPPSSPPSPADVKTATVPPPFSFTALQDAPSTSSSPSSARILRPSSDTATAKSSTGTKGHARVARRKLIRPVPERASGEAERPSGINHTATRQLEETDEVEVKEEDDSLGGGRGLFEGRTELLASGSRILGRVLALQELKAKRSTSQFQRRQREAVRAQEGNTTGLSLPFSRTLETQAIPTTQHRSLWRFDPILLSATVQASSTKAPPLGNVENVMRGMMMESFAVDNAEMPALPNTQVVEACTARRDHDFADLDDQICAATGEREALLDLVRDLRWDRHDLEVKLKSRDKIFRQLFTSIQIKDLRNHELRSALRQHRPTLAGPKDYDFGMPRAPLERLATADAIRWESLRGGMTAQW